MKKLYVLLSMLILGIDSNTTAKPNEWEEVCPSPEIAYMVNVCSNNEDVVAVRTLTKLFLKGQYDNDWSFISNLAPSMIEPSWFNDSKYLYSITLQELIRVEMKTKQCDHIALPVSLQGKQFFLIAAQGNKCALWDKSSDTSYRFIYDFDKGTWSEGAKCDFRAQSAAVDCFGNIWTSSFNSNYNYSYSTDFGDTWVKNVISSSSKIRFDQHGSIFTQNNNNDTIYRLSNSGELIDKYFYDGRQIQKFLTLNDSILVFSNFKKILYINTKSKKLVDSIEFAGNFEISGMALIGDQLFITRVAEVYKVPSMGANPVQDSKGISDAASIFACSAGEDIFIRSYFGLYKVVSGSAVQLNNFKSSISGPDIKDFLIAQNNDLYQVCFRDSLMRSTDAGSSWTSIKLPNDFEPVGIVKLLDNKIGVWGNYNESVLWVGPDTDEADTLFILDPKLSFNISAVFDFVYVYLVLSNNYTFIVSKSGQVLSSDTCKIFDEVADCFNMGNGRIWIASDAGFHETSNLGSTWTNIHGDCLFYYPMQLEDQSILYSDILSDKITRLMPDGTTYNLSIPIPDQCVTSLFKRDNFLYATVLGGGLYRIPYSVTPVHEPAIKPDIIVFPNPALNMVTVKMDTPLVDCFQLSIYDMLGIRVDATYFLENGKILVNTTNLLPGIYVVVVNNNGKSTEARFTVTR